MGIEDGFQPIENETEANFLSIRDRINNGIRAKFISIKGKFSELSQKPIVKKIKEVIDEASWAFTESELISLLEKTGISSEKSAGVAQIIKYYEDHHKVNHPKDDKNDNLSYDEKRKVQYRFDHSELKSLVAFAARVDNPLDFFEKAKSYFDPRWNGLRTFLNSVSNLNNPNEAQNYLPILDKVDHLLKISFPTEFLNNFSSLSAEDAILFSDENIGKLNNLSKELIDILLHRKHTEDSNIYIRPEDLVGFLRMVEDDRLVDLFKRITSGKFSRANSSNFPLFSKRIVDIKQRFPILFELENKGFDIISNVAKYLASSEHNLRTLEKGDERSRIAADMVPNVNRYRTEILDDENFCQNTIALKQILDMNLSPNSSLMDSDSPGKPDFRRVAEAEELKPALYGFKHLGKIFRILNDFDYDAGYRTSRYDQIQKTYKDAIKIFSGFSEEEIVDVASQIDENSLDFILDGLDQSEQRIVGITTCKLVFSGKNSNSVKEKIVKLMSDDVKTIISEESWILAELIENTHSQKSNVIARQKILDFLIGETDDENIKMSLELFAKKEIYTQRKEILKDVFSFSLTDLSLMHFLTTCSEEKFSDICRLLQQRKEDSPLGHTTIDNIIFRKAILLSSLENEGKPKIEEFLEEKFGSNDSNSTTITHLMNYHFTIKTVEQITTKYELFFKALEQLNKYIDEGKIKKNYLDIGLAELNKLVPYLIELGENNNLFGTLIILSQYGYEPNTNDISGLKKIAADTSVLTTIATFNRTLNRPFKDSMVPLLMFLNKEENGITKFSKILDSGLGMFGIENLDIGKVKFLMDNEDLIDVAILLRKKAKYEFNLGNIDLLVEMREHPEYLNIIVKLGETGFKFNYFMLEEMKIVADTSGLFDFIITLKKDYKYDLNYNHVSKWKNLLSSKEKVFDYLNNATDTKLFFDNIEYFNDINPENMHDFLLALNEIRQSKSREVQNLSSMIIKELSKSSNPYENWLKIDNLFARNHLPTVVKINKIFEILYDPENFEEILSYESKDLSPTLKKVGAKDSYKLISRDLLLIHLRSGNGSLKRYLETLGENRDMLSKVESNGVESLSTDQVNEFRVFLSKMDALYYNVIRNRKNIAKVSYSEDEREELKKRFSVIRRRFQVGDGENFVHKLQEMVLSPLGINSIDDALKMMEESKDKALSRNIEVGKSGKIDIAAGDLIKGIRAQFLPSQLENGVVAKEFLGADSGSDATPFDTDLGEVLEVDLEVSEDSDNSKFRNAVEKSVANHYAVNSDDVFLFVKDRGQFRRTASSNYQKETTLNPEEIDVDDTEKYEIFNASVVGASHRGIRTGFPFTEVDAIIVKDENNKEVLNRICYYLAQKDLYVPIVNFEGEVLISPEEFESYKYGKDSATIFNSEEIEEYKIISELKKNPYIKTMFESENTDGLTLEQHTGLVLSNYESFLTYDEPKGVLSQKAFRLVLAFHDIGKPLSFLNNGNSHNQHIFTRQIVEPLFANFGLTNTEIELAVGIVSNDFLGKLFQEQVSIEETAKEIRRLAEDNGVNSGLLLNDLYKYYVSDVLAYTKISKYNDPYSHKDKQVVGTSGLESVFSKSLSENNINLSDENNEILEQLKKLI